jgi:hypothetical protein
MILRNLTSTPQTVSDGPTVKTVSPLGLVAVTPETGFRLLSHQPAVWVTEQALVPPPPPSA